MAPHRRWPGRLIAVLAMAAGGAAVAVAITSGPVLTDLVDAIVPR